MDAAWKRAVDAGAKPVMPLADMFWGDRTGRLEDPFGHTWSLSQHVQDLTPEEIRKGQEAFFAQLQTTAWQFDRAPWGASNDQMRATQWLLPIVGERSSIDLRQLPHWRDEHG